MAKIEIYNQFILCVDVTGIISIVYLQIISPKKSLLRLFHIHKTPSLPNPLVSVPQLLIDSENKEIFIFVINHQVFFLNFEKILESCIIQSHSILEFADHEFIQHALTPGSKLVTQILLDSVYLGLLTSVKYFKVGILGLCFNNGSIQFYNENTSKLILEYKNSQLTDVIDIFPSYYAKKNKKDDLLTIIEGFNRIFVLNSFGRIFILDFQKQKLEIVGRVINI